MARVYPAPTLKVCSKKKSLIMMEYSENKAVKLKQNKTSCTWRHICISDLVKCYLKGQHRENLVLLYKEERRKVLNHPSPLMDGSKLQLVLQTQ